MATGIVATTFFYFLIFAQFAFLHRIEALDADKILLQPVMLLMGVGGLVGCGIAWQLYRAERIRSLLAASFLACSILAFLAVVNGMIRPFLALGLGVGVALGCLTVSVVAYLRLRLNFREIAWCSAAGTGLAYFVSNVPALFDQLPEAQCYASSVSAFAGFCFSLFAKSENSEGVERSDLYLESSFGRGKGFWGVVALFFVLVWLDSAAFYVIQETDTLKQGSWGSDVQLWGNGMLHLLAAGLSGYLLVQRKLSTVLFTAGVLLVAGSLWLKNGYGGLAWVGSSLYVVGVSFYSAALVSFTALVRDQGSWNVAKRAALLFGIAGWVASGLGIGMARDLGTVPYLFLGIATLALVALSLILRVVEGERRE